METDDLRKEETQFMVAGCQLEREKQLMDKRAKLEQAIAEEQVYAKLWMLDAEKKAERERLEAEAKKKKTQETMNILSWQTTQQAAASSAEKERRAKEQVMLKQQWQLEQEADAEAERQKFILNRERNMELINHNAAEKELRGIALEAEKARDKELLDAALAREQALADLEAAERIAKRTETIELQKHYKKTQGDKNAMERQIDAFVAEEADRQYKMREAQWERERQARINLLKDVYVSREQDILLKQEKKREAKWYADYESKQIQDAMVAQKAEFEARAAKEAAARKNHQMDILKQMNEKDRLQRQYL